MHTRDSADDRLDRPPVRTDQGYVPDGRSAAEVMEGELPGWMTSRNHKTSAGPAESQIWWREIEARGEDRDGQQEK